MNTKSFNEEQLRRFEKSVANAISELDDLTVPYTLMAKSWFKSNKSLFLRAGKGRFEDLSTKYKPRKEKKWGFIYPILRASGKLERSITDPSDTGAVNLILNKKYLILGTKVRTRGKNPKPYPSFLHFGTSKMPARPFILVGNEQTATQVQNVRLESWIKLLDKFVVDTLKKTGMK